MIPRPVQSFARILSVSVLGGLLSCAAPPRPHAVVGAWVVEHHGAPFQYHMYVFNGDGTMQQANPDAGNARNSDSDGKGVWVAVADTVKGKFVEMQADRVSHAFIGRGEISFTFVVKGDSIIGSAVGRFFDAKGAPSDGPVTVDMVGSRVKLP